MPIETQVGKVIKKRRWTEHLYSIRITAQFNDFESGQFARIGLPIDGANVLRPYSFVNTPQDEYCEFFYTIVPEGPLSTRLPHLDAGDDILYVAKPNGYLVLSEVPSSQQLWMLATGTAIGPFLSILKNKTVWGQFENIILAYAVRYAAELAYADEIYALVEKSDGRLQFFPFVSREKTDFAMSERIPAALESGQLQKKAGFSISADDSQVMICGNPQMVKDTTAILQAMGLERNRRRKPGHITMENYW